MAKNYPEFFEFFDIPNINSKPEIEATILSGVVIKNYTFSITQSRSGSIDNAYKYPIRVELSRYINRRVLMSDGSEKEFTEDNDPQHMFYILSVGTKMDFVEAIDFFKQLGLTDDAEVINLTYGDNYIKKSPFIFRDLDARLISDINNCDGYILLRLHGEKSTDLENSDLFYEKIKIKGAFDIEEEKRSIAYRDNKIVKPRFDQILSASPFELNKEEKEILEDMINKSLRL